MRRRFASCFLAGVLAVNGGVVAAEEGAASGFGRWLRNPFAKEKTTDSPSPASGNAEVPPVRVASPPQADNTPRRGPAAQSVSTPRRIGAATPRVAEPDATVPSAGPPAPVPTRPPLLNRRLPSARAARGSLSDDDESTQPTLRVPPPDHATANFPGQSSDAPPVESPRRRLIPLTGNVEPPRPRGPAAPARQAAPPFVVEQGIPEPTANEPEAQESAVADPAEQDAARLPSTPASRGDTREVGADVSEANEPLRTPDVNAAEAPPTPPQRPLMIKRRGLFGVREVNPASSQQPAETAPETTDATPPASTSPAKRGRTRGRDTGGDAGPGLAIESGEVADVQVTPSVEPTEQQGSAQLAEETAPPVADSTISVEDVAAIEDPQVPTRSPRSGATPRVTSATPHAAAPKEKAASETPPEKPSMTQRWKSWWGSKK